MFQTKVVVKNQTTHFVHSTDFLQVFLICLLYDLIIQQLVLIFITFYI